MTAYFDSRVYGVPCRVEVLHYQPGSPMRVTGTGFGDADPPEDPEFDFILTLVDGQYFSDFDDAMNDPAVHSKLLKEYVKRLRD